MSVADPRSKFVGQALKRKEDPRLITGRGKLRRRHHPAGTLWCAFVRSPEAHAKIVSIDKSLAEQRDGVLAVFTGEDMATLGIGGALPDGLGAAGRRGPQRPHWPLASGEVNHVGDPVAVVIGEDRYAMLDAAEQVFVEYEPAARGRSTSRRRSRTARRSSTRSSARTGATSGRSAAGTSRPAWPRPTSIIERRVVNHRIAGAPIEPRGVLAE